MTTLHSITPTTLPPQPGPWPGIDAFAGVKPQTITLPKPLGDRGAIALWARLDAPIHNGPDVEADGHTLLTFPGMGKVHIWWNPSFGGIGLETAEGMPDRPVLVPGLPGPQWVHICYTWDAPAGRIDGYINGTPTHLPGSTVTPWIHASADRVEVDASRWTLAGLAVSDRCLERHEVLAQIPSVYRGGLDHNLGAQDLGHMDADLWRGEKLFDIPLAQPDDLEGWQMEGPGEVRFEEGWMHMRSAVPDAQGNEGHFVHWCPRDLPDDFLLEFQCRILGEHGLNIIFFCAKARDGRDALDPTLPERTGIFGHYTMGELDCYHVSYFSNSPRGGGRATSNLRKNHGFHVVDNGPIGIAPGDHSPQRVSLLKVGGQIQLALNGRIAIDWFDAGKQYGPVLGAGKIALRQMRSTQAAYRNLTAWSIKQAGDAWGRGVNCH